MYVIVTVREASSRLPGKCFLDLGYGAPRPVSVLEHVIARCRNFGFIPIVSTTVNDAKINALCMQLHVACYMGSNDDKLERWLQTCERFSVDSFVTVDCDDPLFDPAITKDAYHYVSRSEKIAVINSSVSSGDAWGPLFDVCRPDLRAYLGAMGWGFSIDALEKICASKSSTQTEMVWKHFPPGLREFRFDARPHWIEQKIRLTLDYEEDLWLIRTVVRELGPMCTREQIVGFFTSNPGLTVINGFRNEEWKRRQE